MTRLTANEDCIVTTFRHFAARFGYCFMASLVVAVGMLVDDVRGVEPNPFAFKNQRTDKGARAPSVVIGARPAGGEKPGFKTAPGKLNTPFGVGLDAKGTMYIVELSGGRVHRLNTSGQFATISGDGSKGYAGDGGPAAKATFNGMHNVAVTRGGDVYISDSWNHAVRKIDGRTGVITTVAGTGKPGFSGDGGPADKATFNFLMCVTLGPQEEKLYLADLRNRRIRVMDLKSGIVRTVAGNGKRGVPRDGGDALRSPLVDPRAVAVDSKYNVYILERGGHALRRVTPEGKIHTVAGTGKSGSKDGPALSAQLSGPKHLCIDDRDRVIIADEQNRLIRLYDPRGKTLSTVLGRGEGDRPCYLSKPHGVCFYKGILYVVDTGHHRILKLDWKNR